MEQNINKWVGIILGMQGWFNIKKTTNIFHHINSLKKNIGKSFLFFIIGKGPCTEILA
jgi:hypothetical protein